MKQLRQWLRRLTGFSTPLIGVSWSPPDGKYHDFTIFDGCICITSSGNEEFVSFLVGNVGKIVFIDSTIDANIASKAQSEFVEAERIDIDSLLSGSFSGKVFPLLNDLEDIAYVEFRFSADRALNVSFGGTGTIMVPFNGFFEISMTLHGGPSRVFHLKEIDAPLEARLEIIERRRASSE